MASELIVASITQAPSPTMWYLTRATAVAAYVLLSCAVTLGLLQSLGRIARERLSWVTDELHQFIASMALLLVAGHLTTLLLDPFLPFTLANLFVPAHEPYRSSAVNVGVMALYLMVVVLGSSWLRQRIPHSLWRAIHYLGILLFVLVTIHGWLAGSDASEPWMRAIYGGSTAAVVFLVLMRLTVRPEPAGSPGKADQGAR